MRRYFAYSREWNDEVLIQEFNTKQEAEVFAEVCDMRYACVNDSIEERIKTATEKQVAKYQDKKIKHLKSIRISITKQ